MKVATWNVNSVRIRKEYIMNFIYQEKLDILLLQELKCQTEQFPITNYYDLVLGQKSYNGVAIISKYPIKPIFNDLIHNEARLVVAEILDFIVISLYVPNGRCVGSQYYKYKLEFLDYITKYFSKFQNRQIILGGDFNITMSDLDVYNPTLWREKICCSTPERDKLKTLLGNSLLDTQREMAGQNKIFTWWNYRNHGYIKNHGLRLDYIFTTQDIQIKSWNRHLEYMEIDRPSDHVPISITL